MLAAGKPVVNIYPLFVEAFFSATPQGLVWPADFEDRPPDTYLTCVLESSVKSAFASHTSTYQLTTSITGNGISTFSICDFSVLCHRA